MSGGHQHEVEAGAPLDGPIERLAPEAKLVGLVAFVVVAVATPPTAVAALVFDLLLVGALVVVALVPGRTVARRLVFEIPFLALAVALVVLGTGPTVDVGPFAVSRSGLWSAWAVLSRATIGVLAASVLAATTTPAELVEGLDRLRLPRVLRTIAAVTVRYLAVLRLELDRLRLARELRSPDRGRLPAREVAGIGGALFVRAYERGERAHLAMAARAPSIAAPSPATRTSAAGRRSWVVALLPAALAALVASVVVLTTGTGAG